MDTPFVEFNPGRALKALGAQIDNPAPVLKAIGEMLASRAQRAFQDQARGPAKWMPRAVPNRAGIVADLLAGRTPPLRRLDPTPAGIDTGRLQGAMSSQAVSMEDRVTVRVGTNLDYARLIRDGGTSVQPVTATVKEALAELLTREPWKSYGDSLGSLLRPEVSTLTTQIPARPYLTIDDTDRKDIFKMLLDAWTGKRYQTVGV